MDRPHDRAKRGERVRHGGTRYEDVQGAGSFFFRDYMDSYPVPANTVAEHYGIDGEKLERQYKEHLSGYREWDQFRHAEEWLLFPENIGEWLSIDETSPSQGELYTIVSNKAAHNGKGTIVAIVRGTRS